MLISTLTLASILGLTAQAAVVTTVAIPSSPPSSNSYYPVTPSFANLAFEWSGFLAYCQNTDGSNNQYTINLLNTVFGRGTGHPVLRVGGNSLGSNTYSSSQTTAQNPSPMAGSNQPAYTWGPTYWSTVQQALSSASPSVVYIPQMLFTPPAAQQDEIAGRIVNGLKPANILAVELGNEPNCANTASATACNGTALGVVVQSDIASLKKAYSAAGATGSYLGPDYCGEGGQKTGCTGQPNNVGYNIQDLFKTYNFGSFLNYASDHYYRCNGGACSLPDIMNHANMVSSAAQIKSNAAYFNSINRPYVLTEVNVLNGAATPSLTRSLAAALWEVDFFMYCMTIGVRQVHFESNLGSDQSTWIPSTASGLTPLTHQGYYALLATADFYKGADTVAQISPGGGNDGTTFSAYVAYSNNKPIRVALLNLNYFQANSTSGARPAPAVTVSGIPSGITQVTVNYLTSTNGAADLEDQISYAGKQYLAANQGAASNFGSGGVTPFPVTNGAAQVTCPYSSAAIVTW